MCNLFERRIPWPAYAAAMERLDWGSSTAQFVRDLPPADNIRISDTAPVLIADGNGAALTSMRWAFPPPKPRASPVFNFRSEGRHFKDSNRCLIPASAFFEFTGTKSPKTKHRFTLVDGALFAIAGIWRTIGDEPHFTMLTTEPGPDVAPYHNRQVVVLPPADWPAWVYLTRPEGELLRPLPVGSLREETVRS